jgi:REP element-mobilizing transposase RayT
MPLPSHGKNLRHGRHSQSGQIYLVTAVTQNRHPVFADFGSARTVIRALRAADALKRAETLAFVLMPDHLHWLLTLGEPADLPALVRSVKSVSAHALGGGLWQRGFHDRALRREESVVEAARYIVANPVRAGLVARAGDYSHWDAVWL